MSLKKKFITSMLVGGAILATSQNQAFAAKAEMEKCFGVVKAGQNDCANSAEAKNSHSCAGEAKSNGLKTEWILLPKGSCEKIVNGSLS